MPIYYFDEMVKGKRPDGALVKIETEQIIHVTFGLIERTTQVTGIIFAQSTKGRKSAPEPLSGFKVSESEKVSGTPIVFSRNTGAPDLDKGHIMALELGGPDVPANIVPQWSNFQRNGKWKLMENAARTAAEQLKSGVLVYHAIVVYKVYQNLGQASLKGIGVPCAFKVFTWVEDQFGLKSQLTTIFDRTQEQDQTDDMMKLRLFAKADGLDYMAMYDDLTTKGSGKKEKMTFADQGQDPMHTPTYAPLFGPPPIVYSRPVDPQVGNLNLAAVSVAKAKSLLPDTSKGDSTNMDTSD
jgi:hypothetical protein